MTENVIRNEYGEVVFFGYSTPQESASRIAGATPQQIANQFIREHKSEMNLTSARIDADFRDDEEAVGSAGPVIAFESEKDIAGAQVVVYKQTVLGLDVFNASMGVQIDSSSMNVASMQSSMHAEIEIENPDQIADPDKVRKVTKTALKKILGFDLPKLEGGTIHRQVVYRYEPDEREEPHAHDEGGCLGGTGAHIPHLPKPTLKGLAKGKHYVCDEILFEAALVEEESPINWRALVEPASGDVLYLRALVACATGLVYDRDPQTQGGATVTGASSNAQLNPFRTSVTLPGLIPATPQPLSGNFVRLQDLSAPTIAPPVVPGPASAFNYDVRTDEFSAVNAYYNCDRLFRTMQDYGFNVAAYFDGTTFPVPVDHRGKGGALNADAPGNAAGNGLGMMRYGLILPPNPVGIATSNRVVWHEFGHALLWDHVNSPNFGFAHSAGDSLAAILNDPGSLEADRFDTFPWVQEGMSLNRRHDRAVSAGWAWFGPQYNTQYQGEQILSTTMFRFYRSIGGDSSNINTQRRAAQTSAFLIFKGIGLLTATTQFPEIFVNALQTADRTTPNFKGIAGGALHKVIRWAFEKQGLFQPGAAPGQGNNVNSEGNPPDVDVYIDDGRGGEYTYLANHWSCQDMWVRRAADGGTTHEHPLVGMTNYMYVRVKNRGTQTANAVRVDAYHCLPGAGLAFPDDWSPMATASLPASGSIPSGGSTIVGPFAFVPTQVGHECLLAIARADGDAGNDTTITGTIPEHRFVPFDNNIGQRNVSPVYPSLRDLLRLFREHLIVIRNPWRDTVVARIEVRMPRIMSKLGWQMKVDTGGGEKFEIGPRERRKVLLSIEPGEELKPDYVKRAMEEGDAEIVLHYYLDDELVGGMTYPLSFEAGEKEDDPQRPKPEDDRPKPEDDRPIIVRRPTIEEILKILRERGRIGDILGGRIRTVRMEFDVDDDDKG